MKKSTGSILLLSAFAALVLAGCGDKPKDSSTTTGSSDTAVQTSADETSAAGTSTTTTSAAGTSTAGTSATGTSAAGTSTASSSAAASSSSAAASSSTPAVETDWSQKSFIGEYKGGMNNLIINSDKTTSWGTSTDKFPATYTDMGGGVYMIKSTAAVADEDYVEVITDGTMAYVMHDKEAYDYYVMDKNALGSAVIAFAETEDEENYFGGIEVTAGHWKYFACIGGTYTFGATITMQAGTNINAGGAIFDYGTGANKISWKVTSGAVAATAFATIEQTTFTATTYTGDHGDLVIGTDNDGLVFAKLNDVTLDGATLSADGSVLSVPNGSDATSVDRTDPAGPMMVLPTTTYTLAKIALTYTEGTGTIKTPLFQTITGPAGTYQAATDNSGNVWVVYTATESGVLDVEETDGEVADSYLMIFDSTASDYTTTTSAIDYDDNGVTTGCTVQAIVIAGHSYVIKLGSYYARTTNYDGTSASYADQDETFEWTFTAFTHDTYTGDEGELDLLMSGSDVMSVTLAGVQVDEFKKLGNLLSTESKATDLTNPADIVVTTTTKTYTLDPTTATYTVVSTPVDVHPFHAFAETDTSYTATTGNDGNLWASFTPSKAGMITIGTSFANSNYNYLQIFEFDPATGLNGLTSTGAKRLVYQSGSGLSGVKLSVQSGVTYIIKLGVYSTLDLLPGDTTTTASYIGVSGTITFNFVDYIIETFTGAEGDLVIATKDGQYKSATLDGAPIEGRATYDPDNGVYSVTGTQTLDMTTDPDDPVLNSTDDVYTLDLVNHTYTKVSQPGVYHVLNVLTDTSTGLSGFTGEDGSLWAIFTPTADGVMSIDETVQATNSSGYHDTLLAVYEKTATSAWADYVNYSSSYNSQQALNYTFQSAGADNGTAPVYVHYMPVQGGHTYIIKIGAYAGNSVTVGGQLASSSASYAGQPEAFRFNFGQIITNTYTCDGASPLTVKTVNGELYSATLGTTALTTASISEDGKSLTVQGTTPVINNSNPLDPVATYTNTIYYLDNSGMTYETDSEIEEQHFFQTLQPTDTGFTGTVGADGNLWGVFTAPDDGVISVEETATASSTGDGYIAVYESTAASYTTTNAIAKNDYGSSVDNSMGGLPSVPVQAGHTYIIKGGAWADRDKTIGGSATSSYAGNTETISFTYTGYTYDTYTGAEGDLVKKSFGTTYMSATLDGNAFTATPNDDQSVYTLKTSSFDSTELKVTTDTKTYTLGEGTYEVATNSEEINLLADSWTAGNTGTYETLDNGSVIIAFTPTADGTYTFNLDGVDGTDVKFGLYAANFNDTGFSGSPLKVIDSGSGGAGETFTYACTAGTTYYIRATYHYSDWSKAITSMTSTRGGNELTIAVVDPTPAP